MADSAQHLPSAMDSPSTKRDGSYAGLRQSFNVVPTYNASPPATPSPSRTSWTLANAFPSANLETGVGSPDSRHSANKVTANEFQDFVHTSPSKPPANPALGHSSDAGTLGSDLNSSPKVTSLTINFSAPSRHSARLGRRQSDEHAVIYGTYQSTPTKKRAASSSAKKPEGEATQASKAFSANIIARRHAFLKANKHVFMPLLPPNNWFTLDDTSDIDLSPVKFSNGYRAFDGQQLQG